MTTNKELGPVVFLQCACCGKTVQGRQWWNRDTGYGVCLPCGERAIRGGRDHGYDGDQAERLYGVRGIHWDVRPIGGAS